ncbi:MAG: cysteine methyltransferase [Sphingomonas sp. 28-62-20]|uniref:methylated-DNA--[protein]-cysteine S-methyltransferase n=1 Tax=Sphingomonas sp. 28-62-20 TaxID=1970433 RepID=UPI000BCF6376|nr:MAG: cysteine methyltransferase [Sphingomonas sp. 28-62-20]
MSLRDHAQIATPIGVISVTVDGPVLTAVRIGAGSVSRGTSALLAEALDQLNQYFAGERHAFDLPLAPAATPRGGALRAGITGIGYGQTASYGDLARMFASSPRAIGQACARNPFPIIVPCHRVLAANGALGAYSAGEGPATKTWLIAHERHHLGDRQ